MEQLICVSLSHAHYWYEVGMLEVVCMVIHIARVWKVAQVLRCMPLFLERRIQPFLSLVDREVEICALTI